MNREPEGEHAAAPPFRQEPDSLNTAKAVRAGIITLFIFAIGCVWATRIWIARTNDMNPKGSTIPSELGKREIGIVDQVPFDQMDDPAIERVPILKRLHSYGWADEKRNLIHMPIERGYELVIAEQKGRKQ